MKLIATMPGSLPLGPSVPHASPADLIVGPFVQVLSKVGQRAELCWRRRFEKVLSLSCEELLWSQRYQDQLVVAFVVRVYQVFGGLTGSSLSGSGVMFMHSLSNHGAKTSRVQQERS